VNVALGEVSALIYGMTFLACLSSTSYPYQGYLHAQHSLDAMRPALTRVVVPNGLAVWLRVDGHRASCELSRRVDPGDN